MNTRLLMTLQVNERSTTHWSSICASRSKPMTALIYMTFSGLRDDAHRYFRTLPRFETAASKYEFLNRLLAVGIGEIHADGPVHIIEEIL